MTAAGEGRIAYAVRNANLWLDVMKDDISVTEMEGFAASAEQTAREKSNELTKFIKEKGATSSG